jgi:prepilin-type N-terminal cleavage/methylation domain-containing protein/prepilin-type processing-associated H-X9-DG protein
MKMTIEIDTVLKTTCLSAIKPRAMGDLARKGSPALRGFTSGVKASRDAFTLIELLVVIAIIAILAAMLMPVLMKAQERARTIQCESNQKQLIMAWDMYPQENQDFVCPNPALSIAQGADTIGTTWVLGYMHCDPNTPDNTNIVNLQTSLLAPYCSYATKIYKCPDDTWKCAENDVLMDRVRSVSMNTCIEGNYYEVNGNNGSYPISEANYPATQGIKVYCYVKLTDIGPHTPGPNVSDMWVMTDENPNTINNGNMSWFSNGSFWSDTPGGYHSNGSDFSFSDGHVEFHKWQTVWSSSPAGTTGAGTGLANWPCQGMNPPNGGPSWGSKVDYAWVTDHATASHP